MLEYVYDQTPRNEDEEHPVEVDEDTIKSFIEIDKKLQEEEAKERKRRAELDEEEWDKFDPEPPRGMPPVVVKPLDFESGWMDPELARLKGKAYVFLTDQSEKALSDYRGKINENDRICRQIITDLQVWKNPYLRFPFATHRVAGVSVPVLTGAGPKTRRA